MVENLTHTNIRTLLKNMVKSLHSENLVLLIIASLSWASFTEKDETLTSQKCR